MLAAKLAAPCPISNYSAPGKADRFVDEVVTLFSVSPGYLITENLVTLIQANQRDCIWLRINAEDCDPGTFLLSLLAATQHLNPKIGAATLEQMQRHPGPVAGWARLFTQFGQELRQALAAPFTIVLENVQHLVMTHPGLELFSRYIFPALAPDTRLVLTGKSSIPRSALPPHTHEYRSAQLRLDPQSALELAHHTHVTCTSACIQRALALLEGRAVALYGLFETCVYLGEKSVQPLVDSARDCDDLLARLARMWLVASDRASLETLALAIQLEYTKPGLSQVISGQENLPSLPWLQPLHQDWVRLRQVWHPALLWAMPPRAALDAAQLGRAADFLLNEDATEQAISLYLETGNAPKAAEVIAGKAELLLNFGQWETLTGWLDRLPTHVLHSYPQLIHVQGEIAAAQGDRKGARRAFAIATGLFTMRNDRDGACSSLLAESALAAQEGNLTQAQDSARAALEMARAFQLAWPLCWAAWQMGALLVSKTQFEDALGFFELAAEAVQEIADPVLVEILNKAIALTANQQDLRREQESLRLSFLGAERLEQEVIEQLRQLLGDPSRNLDAFMERHGWSRTPLLVKLPAMAAVLVPSNSNRTGLWNVLQSAMNLRHRLKTTASSESRAADSMNSFSAVEQIPNRKSFAPASSVFVPAKVVETTLAFAPETTEQFTSPAPRGASSASTPLKPEFQVPALVVYCLGTFRVTFNDIPIENMPSGKGKTLFKYILAHHDKSISRDLLMELLWPNADPDAARNRLNVALHGSRQALRLTTDTPIILFEENAYRLNPDLHLWLDVEDFERHVQAGHKLAEAGDLAAAVVEYELAAGLYQGDFLEEDMYEDWTVLTRERLRGDYLDILDRLSRIHFAQAHYSISATLCKLILERDNCSEPACRRLMRCYARQGQPHLALRQYQICIEALRRELDVAPAPPTTELYEQIRRGELV